MNTPKKRSTSEKGHTKNLANFKKLRETCIAFPNYNPSSTALAANALLITEKQAKESLKAISAASAAYKLRVDDRQLAFKPVSKFLTRLTHAVKSVDGITKENVGTFTSLTRKYRGARKSAALAVAEAGNTDGDNNTPEKSSVAQLSFDNRVAHFNDISSLLGGMNSYNPNEEDLTLVSVEAMCQQLDSANAAVLTATVGLGTSRINRDKVLYTTETGLVDVGYKLKNYIASKFGTDSAEWKKISKIIFVRLQ